MYRKLYVVTGKLDKLVTGIVHVPLVPVTTQVPATAPVPLPTPKVIDGAKFAVFWILIVVVDATALVTLKPIVFVPPDVAVVQPVAGDSVTAAKAFAVTYTVGVNEPKVGAVLVFKPVLTSPKE